MRPPQMPPPTGKRPARMHAPRSFLTENEKQNKPKVTKELLLRIAGYLKPYLPQFLLVFLKQLFLF